MTELMSFEEFLKENEKTAKIYAKQYVEGEYRRKYREEERKKNPDLKKNQLNKMTVSAVEAFKKSPDFEKLVEKLPAEKIKNKMMVHYNHYCEEVETLNEYERMSEAVVTAIPEHIKDAYPKARMMKRKFILHIGPTNSGKTFTALQKFREAHEAAYLAPLRLLALEVYENTNAAGVECSLLTGEEEAIVNGASHVSETIEMADLGKHYDVAVIDECQMIADESRGGAWTAAILGLCAEEIHICMAPNAEDIVRRLVEYCGDEIIEEIDRKERMTPLTLDEDGFRFPDGVKPGDALIVFSKRSVINVAAELQARKIACSMIYGALPYETRKAETERFLSGETQVVVATDAIGMGLNLPVKRVVFLETEKFDGYEVRLLKPEEVQQIAGRAGRKGIYDEGKFTAGKGRKFIRRSMSMKPEDINFARIRFPRFLTAVEGKLSDVMNKWDEVETESLFLKADIEQQLKLCEWIENYTDNKDLIYRLINIPFNKKNDDMVFLWQTLAERVAEEHTVDLTCEIETLDIEKRRTVSISDVNKRIQELEGLYQKYDLIHNFVRLFGMPDTREEQKELIRKKKKEVSDTLTEVLKTKQLKRRQCPDCGRALPYNYQYGICESCYSMRNRGYGYWGDEWF